MASFFARDAANVVRVSMQPGDRPSASTIQVSAQAAEVGSNRGEVEAVVEGPAIDIAFNAKYLLDILAILGGDEVAIECTDAGHPGLFRSTRDDGFTHVIMPMHTGR